MRTLLSDRGLPRDAQAASVELFVSDMTDSMRALQQLFFQSNVDKFEVAQVGDDH
ncbi:MAG: hypothetical protein U1F16_04440 [Turneriella sp.]